MRKTGKARNGGTGRIAGTPSRFFALLVAAALLHAFSGSALAVGGLIGGTYQLTWDHTVDKTDEATTDIRKFKHSLDLKFKGLLTPVIQNEVTLKIEQEMSSDAADINRLLPTLDLGFKAAYWNGRVGGKRTDESTDDPTAPPKQTDSYFVEIFYTPPKSVPDLKAKYTLDTDFQEGLTDTRKQGVTLSSVYGPTEWLEVKGDYARNRNDDRIMVDSDSEDEKSTGQIGLRHMLSDKVKLDAQGSTELSREAKFVSDTGAAVPDSAKEDQTHKFKSLVSYRPVKDTTLDGTYDFELKQNKVNGEHTFTKNLKGLWTQRMGKPYDFSVTFNRNTVEMKHTTDDYVKTEDTLTFDAKAKLSKQVVLSAKYQDKVTEEDHADPTNNVNSGTIQRGATWSGELGTWWVASATFDKTDTLSEQVKTTVDTKYSLKSTFDFKDLNLTFDPSYDITLKKDMLIPESTAVRDFKFKLLWKGKPSRNTEVKVEHTYGRKTDSGAKNVERTDNSTGNLTWKEAFPGWTFAFDTTRGATDKSEDDMPPDISSSFGFKADFKAERLAMNTSVKYDKKSLSDNSGTFDAKASWVAPSWDVSLTYTFKKTFSDALNEGYAVSFTFKYNL